MSRSVKIIILSLLLVSLAFRGYCKHIKGGEIHYTYLGPSPNKPGYDQYELKLRLFISCQSTTGQLETTVILGIYRNSDNYLISDVEATLSESELINLTKPSPCIVHPSAVCYWIREFTVNVDIQKDPSGYTVIFQRCCRIDNIRNITPNVNVGASYFCEIQGTNSIGTSGVNSNPDFGIKDTVLICQGKRFKLDYSATDADGDSLTYEFAPGYYGGGVNNAVVTNPGPPTSWQPLNYATPYSGLIPLGNTVTIDRKTGIISGVAPPGGDYVVCVMVKEYRAGILVSTHRKDFIITVDDLCDFPSADLDPSYITCDGFNFGFHNEAAATPLIHNYYWDFGVPGSTTDTSTLAKPVFTFPDTGVYTVRFFVNKNEPCSDSATTQMSVFPGFFPAFNALTSCVKNPVVFRDTTITRYGTVSSWNWNFGDANNAGDTSLIQDPFYQYSDTGMKSVTLVVGNSKGCLDSVKIQIDVSGKPTIIFPFRDTLICSIDTLQLHAIGNGSFSWSPSANMIYPDSPDPFVYPKTTTYYTATLTEPGCYNSDSLRVRVVDKVTLFAGNDSTICLGDTIRLNPTGDALYFNWSPAASILDNPQLKNPAVSPTGLMTYSVVGTIGKCFAAGSVNIKTVPYPVADAGTDTRICFMDTTLLNGKGSGIRFVWLPTTYLSNPFIQNPLAFPVQTTEFELLVYDTVGCPKPGISKVVVNVNPQIIAFAGNDTSIVIGEPLQLHGSGAPSFLWFPDVGLSRNDIADPVTQLTQNETYVMKTFDEEGCFAYDTINIKVFTTAPDIFVPNAFTPDNKTNNIFRPIPVGISEIEYFRVYNRNGMLVYNTNRIGSGWDGIYNGKPQPVGGYAWMVQGTDYTGKQVTKKGVVVLIR